jgi:hypothetical protein
MNGVAPGVHTAVGQVSYVTYTPGVDAATAVT